MSLLNYDALNGLVHDLCDSDSADAKTVKKVKACLDEQKVVGLLIEALDDLTRLSKEVDSKVEQFNKYYKTGDSDVRQFCTLAAAWYATDKYIKEIQSGVKRLEGLGSEIDGNFLALAKSFRDLLKEMLSQKTDFTDLTAKTRNKFKV